MLIMNNEYSVEVAESVVRERTVDLVAFGKPFIYKPVCFISLTKGVDDVDVVQDLVSCVKNGIPLAGNDRGGRVNYGPYETVAEF